MKFARLDTVVLRRDMPEHGLLAGDLGAVVEIYGEHGLEVEFVQASGQTKALVTLKTTDGSGRERYPGRPNRVTSIDIEL